LTKSIFSSSHRHNTGTDPVISTNFCKFIHEFSVNLAKFSKRGREKPRLLCELDLSLTTKKQLKTTIPF